jgi:hypothetical protein
METLSVVVITFNESRNIRRCLEGVKDLADEIIVLDSFSSDDTCEQARALGARVEQHAFDGHVEQKNRARGLASCNWVLSLDADETPDARLCEAIRQVKVGAIQGDAFIMNRLNFYCGRPVKTCGWYPDRKLRLWRCGLGAWTGRNPHDRYEVPSGSATGHLEGDILHLTYPAKEDLIRQSKKFAQISAGHLRQKSRFYLWLKLLTAPLFRFVRTWLAQGGWKSARDGWDICSWQTREVWMKYRLALRMKAGQA